MRSYIWSENCRPGNILLYFKSIFVETEGSHVAEVVQLKVYCNFQNESFEKCFAQYWTVWSLSSGYVCYMKCNSLLHFTVGQTYTFIQNIVCTLLGATMPLTNLKPGILWNIVSWSTVFPFQLSSLSKQISFHYIKSLESSVKLSVE